MQCHPKHVFDVCMEAISRAEHGSGVEDCCLKIPGIWFDFGVLSWTCHTVVDVFGPLMPPGPSFALQACALHAVACLT